ncbi:MAG TPA: hypothetical protein DCZ95_08590 [Verrucomicrobia bacterium]|nr:MAG: hypothetical protein A2X46_12625 [Lentisphaerae bacterium GWF2_57_35]HBA84136.1 hypothetical protein [Verrucomicrobiota bacterium]
MQIPKFEWGVLFRPPCQNGFSCGSCILDIGYHTSQSVIMTLTPTLWRTCRVLANRKRLELLHYVMATSSASVSDIARALQMPLAVASSYLRALNARGLLRVKRKGRFVVYEAAADPTMPEIGVLLPAIKAIFRTKDPFRTALEVLTGFTHPRRIALLKAMEGGAVDLEFLREKTGISKPALMRHLRKLRKRGCVMRSNKRYQRVRPGTALGRTLLALALQ